MTQKEAKLKNSMELRRDAERARELLAERGPMRCADIADALGISMGRMPRISAILMRHGVFSVKVKWRGKECWREWRLDSSHKQKKPRKEIGIDESDLKWMEYWRTPKSERMAMENRNENYH